MGQILSMFSKMIAPKPLSMLDFLVTQWVQLRWNFFGNRSRFQKKVGSILKLSNALFNFALQSNVLQIIVTNQKGTFWQDHLDNKKPAFLSLLILTLRRPNLLGVQRPVSPDLAKTVKARSDRSEILTNVFGGAENGNFSQKSPNIFWKLSEIDFFGFDFHRK